MYIKSVKHIQRIGVIVENEKFTSLTQKKGKQVYIPNILIEAAKIQDGDYIEVTIRKISKE